jgi:hypothetical protein
MVSKTEFKKYPKIRSLGDDENRDIFKNRKDQIVIEEKIDGGCGCFWFDNNKQDILFGSRNRPLTGGLENGQFAENIKWIKEKMDGAKLDPDFLYYGEYIVPHTMKYNFSVMPKFIGFDILHKDTQFPLGRKEKVKQFAALGLPVVPLIEADRAGDINVDEIDKFIPKTVFAENLDAEGIVIKNVSRLNRFDRPLFAKLVTDLFREKNKQKFTRKTKRDESDKVVDIYVTIARIKKAIHKKTIEDGEPLNKTLMRFIPKMVVEDAFQEEVLEIIRTTQNFDMRMIRKIAAHKCLQVIQEMMIEKVKEEKKK